MSFKNKLSKSLNEKDVENVYRTELSATEGASITSPYGGDGLLQAKNLRSLLEFKYNENFKNKLAQTNVLVQCLYYLKKYEEAGDKLPSTIFVGDINECFAIHTNSIVKYLSSEIDWKIAPSEAHKKNPELIKAMVGDENILPFVYDIDDSFTIKTIIEKIKDLSENVIRKVRITKHNIVAIFDYFDKNVISDMFGLSTNEKANLFIQIIINPSENYLHPKKKNMLITKSFGELRVNQSLFNSFFSHFEGDIYSPKEKEQLTSLVDRLVDDTVRRNKGEFFTPTAFVDLAHKYISDVFGADWKERFVVWDNSCGTMNLTRDYNFKELYCSTLEQSDIDTANQMGYNVSATKFQFDFLNDPDEKLPQGLQEAINSGKEILFLINPPYATANNLGTKADDHKAGVSDTKIGAEMKGEDWGAASQNLYAQFLYRITKIQERNKNIKIAIFSPPLFLSGGSYKKFREKFFIEFGFEKGFLFEACHFSDVAKNWGISFTIFGKGENKDSFNLDVVDYSDSFELEIRYKKELYNTDNYFAASDWVRKEIKLYNNSVMLPHLSSATTVSHKDNQRLCEGSLGSGCFLSNSVYKNSVGVSIFSSIQTQGNASISNSILAENFTKMLNLFAARKVIQSNWINQKDEYLAPNESHSKYEQFSHDSIVYSLFNNSSQQSSLRQIDYKDKKWDIKNEFFWLSKEEMLSLAEEHHYDNLYKDAKGSENRFVYTKLFGSEGIYNKLSPDAKEILDLASDLLRKSFDMRKLVSENHPEYHLDAFDAGYAQLKLVWKDYFKEEFNAFRAKYKAFEDRLRPLVYELGFLK